MSTLREQVAKTVADECLLSLPSERGFAFAAADAILALPEIAAALERQEDEVPFCSSCQGAGCEWCGE